jgi:effector-binding domain-containing protein
MLRDPELRELTPQETATIHAETSIPQLPTVIGELFSEVYGTVVKAGMEPAGEPFVEYLEMSGDKLIVEVGVPVPHPIQAVGRVHPHQLPGGTIAVGQHHGPYEQIGESYEALGRWLGEHGRAPAGPMWESYLTDPETEPNPAKWRTEIHWPVR